MSAHGTRIWVLITDGVNAFICSSQDGLTTHITTPFLELDKPDLDAADLRAYKAWFKAEGQHRLSQNPAHQHVWHLSQLLLEAARQRAYDGLIVIASDGIATLLNDALAPETRALLMGKVVRDFPASERPATSEPAAMFH